MLPSMADGPPNEEPRPMLTMECPWCDDQMIVDAAMADVTCDTCSVRVEIAPDETADAIVLAA